MFWITEHHFLFVGLFDWGNGFSVFWNWDGFALGNPELENLLPLHP